MNDVKSKISGNLAANRHISIDDLWHLSDKGQISSSVWQRVIAEVRDAGYWRRWIVRMMLVLGVLHLLAGVLFFFAYNWADLSKTTKFALLFSGVGGSFLLWWLLGPDSRMGELAGVAATVLTGVLMAVFGQIYQTGADAYDLFIAWAALTLPWAIVSKSSIHLFVWIVIADVAYGLFAAQVMHPMFGYSSQVLLMINALILVGILVPLSIASRKISGLMTWWLSGTVMIGITCYLVAAGWLSVLTVVGAKTDFLVPVTELLVCLALQAALFVYSFKLEPNILGCTLAQAALVSTITLYVSIEIVDAITSTTSEAFLLMSILIAGASALFIYVARGTAQQMRERTAS